MPPRRDHLASDDSEDESGTGSSSDEERAGACSRRQWLLVIAGLAVAGSCIALLEVRTGLRSAAPAATGGVANAWRKGADEGHPRETASSDEGHPEKPASTDEGQPKEQAPDLQLHFLFMVGQGLPHLDIWQRFFEGAPRGSFHAWVHCQSAEVCRAAFGAQGGLVADLTIVPTVYSEWFVDLVSPMVQLLTYARNATGEAPAKFIFLSESTLPVKPFRVIHEELAKHPGASDFCVSSASSWYPSRDKSAYMVKASQWSVLSLQDAQVLLARLPTPLPYKAMAFPPIGNTTCADFGTCGPRAAAADELYIFGYIFGLFNASARAIVYPGVGELSLDSPAEEQGRCRTWYFFGHGTVSDYIFPDGKKVSERAKLLAEMESDNTSAVSPVSREGEALYVMHTLGPAALQALRNSSFLFARKFDPAGTLLGYAEVMFAD